MPQHIGIVACSAEGAALCYRTICLEGAQLLGPHDHPEVSLHTHALAEYVRHIDRDDWEGVGDLMLSSAHKLTQGGADFLICPDNTIHQAFRFLDGRSPLPWLHIAEAVASEAAARGYRRLALTGTRWLVESDVYPEKLAERGLDFLRPEIEERNEIHRIIMDELVYGVFKPESIAFFQRVIARMKDAGCDAVVLGCTEIPLILDDSTSPLPTLDSTRLLARAALRRALQDPPMGVRESYDAAAEVYAEHLATELTDKPLDRHLLNRFAEEMRGRGRVADVGCGPGHVALYLHEQGVDMIGIDLSPEMIAVARRLHPGPRFRVGDMTRLDLADASLAGIISFYSIVHFEPAEIPAILREMRRVLAPGGLALIAFHIGDQVVHVEDLFGARVSLDFRFHDPRAVIEALRAAGFEVIEHIEREPYEEAEYPSRRCYLFARARVVPPTHEG